MNKTGYTITIPNLESVAFLNALLVRPTATIINSLKKDEEGLRSFNVEFPGGIEKALELSIKGGYINFMSVWGNLGVILSRAKITRDHAPWLKEEAPSQINNDVVKYDNEGITVGCVKVSLEALKLMVEKCEDVD